MRLLRVTKIALHSNGWALGRYPPEVAAHFRTSVRIHGEFLAVLLVVRPPDDATGPR